MVIFRFINSVVKEEIFNPIFCKQRAAKDSHDLHDRAIEFEFMFNDSDKTVGDDVHMDLDADGILRFSPKGLDLEMLLNPFEEEFNLPSVAIQECDILGREVEVVGVVGKGSLQFRSIVDDSSEFRRIVCSVVFPNEADCLIADNIVLSFKEVFSRDNLVCWMPLLSNDKECTRKINDKESREVKVPPVKHIAGKRLVCKPVHGVDIVDVSIGDSVKNRDFRNDVNLGVDPDSGLCRTKLCPSKNRHAEVDGCGVDGIESPMQLEFSNDAFLLGNPHHVESKLFKDAIVSDGISLREHLPVDRQTSKSKRVRFFSMSSSNICEFSQTSASKYLSKHQYKKVAPMGKSPTLRVIVIDGYYSSKLSLGQETHNLGKDILSYMHFLFVLSLNTKKRISNRGHILFDRKNCA